MIRWHLSWLALFVTLSSGCFPSHVYQRATIQIEDGEACFTVSGTLHAQKTPPAITSVMVSNKAGVDAWRWDVPASTAITLAPGRCIPYGYDKPPGTFSYNAPLQPGRAYVAAIVAYVPNPDPGGDPTVARHFSQEFCVRDGPEGREIVLVPRGGDGRSRWKVCDTQDTPAIPGFLTVPVSESLPSGAEVGARNARL